MNTVRWILQIGSTVTLCIACSATDDVTPPADNAGGSAGAAHRGGNGSVGGLSSMTLGGAKGNTGGARQGGASATGGAANAGGNKGTGGNRATGGRSR